MQFQNQFPNQFKQKPTLGSVDLSLNRNTISVVAGDTLVAGMAVTISETSDGLVALPSDENGGQISGFVNYNIKNKSWQEGQAVEISLGGNCMYLKAVGAVARGAQVVIEIGAPNELIDKAGEVSEASGSDHTIVGWAYDKAADGELFRVILDLPGYKLDTPPLDCSAEIAAATAAMESLFVCGDYDTAGSGTAYVESLGVCVGVDESCDCVNLVGAAADSYYAANCL